MYLNYSALIEQSPDELAQLERHYRSGPLADRLTMLRLLKSQTYPSRRALADVLGYSERQLQRWFDTYREGGLEALLLRERPSGRNTKITPEAWQALETEMKAGRIAGLKEAQRFLSEHFAMAYTIGGLSDLFRRRKTKLKTGGRRNRKASAEQQAAFKKTVPPRSPAPTTGAVFRDR